MLYVVVMEVKQEDAAKMADDPMLKLRIDGLVRNALECQGYWGNIINSELVNSEGE